METEQQPATLLNEIVNYPRKVKAFGKEYEVKRFAIGQLARAAEYIAPLGYLMRSAEQADMADLIVKALSLGGEPALGLLMVVTEEPIEWLEEQDPIEGMELLTSTVEANGSYFFDSANLEKLKAMGRRIERVIKTFGPKSDAGTQSSMTSSEPDTAH